MPTGLPWSDPASDPIGDIRATMEKIRNEPYNPDPVLAPIHPKMHDKANDLLGRPHGTPLHISDAYRAAEIELAALTPEEREAVYERIMLTQYGPRGFGPL